MSEDDRSEMMKMCGVNIQATKRDLDLVQMAMEEEDLAGIFVHMGAVMANLKTISQFTRSVYRTNHDI